MTQLSEPPAAPVAGQSTNPLTDSVIQAAVRDAISQSSYRNDDPVPTIGDAPPVAQPGIPPMSQRATDAGRLIMYTSLATVPPGLIVIGIMVASEHANPTVIGMICAAPAVIALAIARLFSSAKQAMPDEIHQHYTGTVYQDQRNVSTETRGVWVKNTNQQ